MEENEDRYVAVVEKRTLDGTSTITWNQSIYMWPW